MEVIIVSGTPGTGKTTYAKDLAKEKSYRYIDVNEVIDCNKLSEDYDDEKKCRIVATSKLNKALISIIKQEKEKHTSGLVIDSHLSHYLPKRYVSRCIITKCELKELRKRLEERGYPENKVRENLDAEIFDTCRVEALEKGHEVEVVNTD